MTDETASSQSPRDMTRPYRFSAGFIRWATIVLVTVLIVCPIVGIILLATSPSPDPQPVGLTLVIVGIGFPILAGAVLGGEAITRGGGLAGLLFFVGFAGVTVLPALSVIWWGKSGAWVVGIAGFVVLLFSVIAFYNIGWKAKVPIWLQLPMFGSPRVYIRGRPTASNGGDPDRDVTLPNRLDGYEVDGTPPSRPPASTN